MVVYDIAVVGFGISGAKVALDAVNSNLKTVIFTGSPKSFKRARSTWVLEGFNNVPGLMETPGKVIIAQAREVIKERDTPFIRKDIISVKKEEDLFLLCDGGDESYLVRFVVLCLGATDEQPELPDGGIRGIFPYANGGKDIDPTAHYCLRCDGHLAFRKDFAVIGNGSSASFVTKEVLTRAVKFQDKSIEHLPRGHLLLHGRERRFSEEEAIELGKLGIEIHPEKIVGFEGEKTLRAINLEGGGKIEVPVAFISLGMRSVEGSIISSLEGLGVEFDEDGMIIVDEKNETGVSGIFSIGDGTANQSRQIYSHFDAANRAVAGEIKSRLRPKMLEAIRKEVRKREKSN